MARVVVGCLLVLFVSSTDAFAQIRRSHWGLSFDFVPTWKVPDYQEKILDADSIELEGKSFRAGFVRGAPRRGEWGLAFVRRSFNDGATVVRDGARTTLDPGARITGGEIHGYSPFVTIKERVQIGMEYAIGAGVIQGTGVFTPVAGASRPVDAKAFFKVFDRELSVAPMARLELVAALIVGRGLKLRASGGLSVPGQHTFSAGATYFFGAR